MFGIKKRSLETVTYNELGEVVETPRDILKELGPPPKPPIQEQEVKIDYSKVIELIENNNIELVKIFLEQIKKLEDSLNDSTNKDLNIEVEEEKQDKKKLGRPKKNG